MSTRSKNNTPDSKSDDEYLTKITKIIEKKMNEFKTEIFKKLESEIAEVVKAQTFISKQYDDIMKQLTTMTKLGNEVESLKQQINCKDISIRNISVRLSEMEKKYHSKDIEITEVAYKKGEKTEDIVIKVAEKLDIPLQRDEIQAVKRIPTKRQSGIPIISVKFTDSRKRDQIISNRKKIITSLEIVGHGDNRIYINEGMSPFLKDLLWRAKSAGRSHGFKYIWQKNGIILAKRDDESKTLMIRTEDDINNYIVKQQKNHSSPQ